MAWYDYINPANWNGSVDQNNQTRGLSQGQAGASSAFGNQLAGNVAGINNQIGQQANYLQGIQNGTNSVSAQQLRQGLQQSLAQQQSMAAGASPNNAAMAARNAAMNMGNLAVGSMGQQAVAGQQERNAAAQQLGGMLTNQLGANIGGANNAMSNAQSGYNNMVQNPAQNWVQQNQQLINMLQSGASALSDRRLKTEVKDASEDADETMAALRAYRFKYTDDKHGKGEQFGIMAQDLEGAGLKHAVIDTPVGKAVHGAKLATSNTAMIARLAERLSKVESRGR